MGFSKRQQPEFRVLVAAAWKAHCASQGLTPSAKPDEAWYRAQLRGATGHESTKDCNAGRDYEDAMAWFEEIEGTSIKWQLRRANGDARRLLHDLNALCASHDVTPEYLRRIAAKALRVSQPPDLSTLTPEQLLTVRIAAKQHVTRGMVAEADRDPQISRKTGMEKPPQVRSFWDALRRHEEQAEREANQEVDIPF